MPAPPEAALSSACKSRLSHLPSRLGAGSRGQGEQTQRGHSDDDSYCCSSLPLRVLPATLRGNEETIITLLTRCNLAPTRPLIHPNSASRAKLAPSCNVTATTGVSPQRGCGTPNTATSATAGCPIATSSISRGYTLTPPEIIMSFLRSTR